MVEIAEPFAYGDTDEPVAIRFNSDFELDGGQFSALGKRPFRYPFQDGVRFTEPIVVHRHSRTKSLAAVIYNMGEFSFNGLPFPQREPLHLSADHYKLTISRMRDSSLTTLVDARTPWFIPTHLLTVEVDGEGDTGTDAEVFLFEIQQFLSFAWGHNVGIALARGTDATGALAFAQWGMIGADPNIPSFNQGHWFSTSHAEILQEILPGYMRKVRDREWKDQLDWALYWWLSANHASQCAETSILASIAGLEVVAAALSQSELALPIQLPPIGRKRGRGDGGSVPAQKIRGALVHMKISIAIGGQLDQLRVIASEKDWDGPEVVVEIRNTLAHPARNAHKGAAFEASQLAMWYLEMALLRLFGFNGECENRTVFEKLYDAQEPVPWTKA